MGAARVFCRFPSGRGNRGAGQVVAQSSLLLSSTYRYCISSFAPHALAREPLNSFTRSNSIEWARSLTLLQFVAPLFIFVCTIHCIQTSWPARFPLGPLAKTAKHLDGCAAIQDTGWTGPIDV
jgi:hypothetical protein